MTRWHREETIDAATARGMADVLAALDNAVDDDAALGRVYAGLSVHGQAPGVDGAPGAAGGTAVPTARARGNAARRWRRALRPAAGLAVALAASAVALAVVGVPGAGHGGAGASAVDTAYVVKRVGGALSAAGSGEIARVTFSGGGTVPDETWSYGSQWRHLSYTHAGHLVYDEGSSAASVYTQVSYLARTWSRGPLSDSPTVLRLSGSPAALRLPGTRGCGSAGPASVAGVLRAGVLCVSLAEAGRQRVDGVDAIKLTGRNSKVFETVWVSPGTYLPLRVMIRPASGSPGPSQEADITWLKPTAQNLARLTVPVPAGFRQVPFPRISLKRGATRRSPGGPPKSG